MTLTGLPVQQKRLRRRVAVFVCLTLLLLVVDQVSKILAVHFLGNGQRYTLIPRLLSLQLVHNPGATLGFGSGRTWVISLAALLACIVIIVLAVRTTSQRWSLVLSFALAGAAGNLADRIIHADGFLNGKVTDFLDYGWSVGNLADVFLAVAALFIIVLVLIGEPFSTPAAADKPAATAISTDAGEDQAALPGSTFSADSETLPVAGSRPSSESSSDLDPTAASAQPTSTDLPTPALVDKEKNASEGAR